MNDADNTTDVDDLINDLKTSGAIKDTSISKKEPEFELDKEKLEQFLLNNSGKLVKDSLEYIEDIGKFVAAAPDSRDVEALAKLVGASAAALENLSKLHVADQRNVTSIGIKQMDIESKKALQQNDQDHKLLLNREELMAKLIKKADIIEVEEN